MEILDDLKYNLLNQFKLFLPTPKKLRKEFLGKVKQKVDFYKPKIEEIIGMSLGDIEVKDYKECLSDIMTEEVIKKDYIQKKNELGRELTEKEIKDLNRVAWIAKKVVVVPFWLYGSFSGLHMGHYKPKFSNKGIIYVSFYYSARFPDSSLKLREPTLDEDIVHELSHSLWYTLDGKRGEGKKRQLIWIEGFATYCAKEHFKKLYPTNVSGRNYFGIYKEGKEKIEELVRKYGRDIVLEVPKRWEEFEGLYFNIF